MEAAYERSHADGEMNRMTMGAVNLGQRVVPMKLVDNRFKPQALPPDLVSPQGSNARMMGLTTSVPLKTALGQVGPPIMMPPRPATDQFMPSKRSPGRGVPFVPFYMPQVEPPAEPSATPYGPCERAAVGAKQFDNLIARANSVFDSSQPGGGAAYLAWIRMAHHIRDILVFDRRLCAEQESGVSLKGVATSIRLAGVSNGRNQISRNLGR